MTIIEDTLGPEDQLLADEFHFTIANGNRGGEVFHSLYNTTGMSIVLQGNTSLTGTHWNDKKQPFQGLAVFLEGVAVGPNGAGIGYVTRQLKPEEAHEGKTIRDLELQPLVGQVVQALQNEQLEHAHAAGRLAPGGGLAFFGIDAFEQGTEDFPIDDGV